MRGLLRSLIALVVGCVAVAPAAAQTTYTWNYSGTDWNTASSWSPEGVPTGADTALLTTFDAPTYNLPSFSANAAVGELDILGPRWGISTPFTGNNHTLTVGTGGQMTTAPLAYRGSFGTAVTLNNLTVNIANGTTFATGYAETVGGMELSGFSSRFLLQNGAQLRLMNPAGITNYDLTINGGAQVSLSAGTQLTNGVGVNTAGQGAIRFHGGGILTVAGGNNVASTFDLNQIAAASGHATVNVSATGTSGSVRLNLGNGTLQRGIDRYTRDSSGTVISLGTGTLEFSFSGPIPGFSGATGQLFFANGAPGSTMPTQNGVVTEGGSSNTNSPYVILTGSIPSRSGFLGRFAAYNSTTGAVTAQQGTARNETTLTSAVAGENVVYRPTTSSANATLANSISPQTVVFEPVGSGQSVDLGGNTLSTPGILVERTVTGTTPYTFTLNNGTIAGSAGSLRNIFVLGSTNTFFNVGATFSNSGGGVVKSGDGTLVLTGTTPQMNIGLDVYINQGTIRARIDGANANFGTTNVLDFRGGVLEVDCNGGTSTFNRSLGNGLNQVNWNFGTSTMVSDRGSGGFAAVNGNLNVNLGGAGQTLVWNGTSGSDLYFLRSGQYLKLGTTQSTGIVTLQNNLALDDGSANLPYDSRTIVAYTQQGSFGYLTPSGRSVISGVISGSAATSLMKSGPATLELTAANTYAGGTAVELGALMVSNTSGSATGTGSVVVRDILLGNGTIAPADGNGVTVMPNGRLYPMREFLTPGNLKIGSDGVDNPVLLRPGAIFLPLLNGNSFDPNGGSSTYSRLTVRGTGTITVDGASLSVGLDAAFTPSGSDVFGILDNQTGNAITGTFAGIAQDGTVNAILANNTLVGTFQVSYIGNITDSGISITGGNDIVLYNFQPVPEPASMLAVGAGAILAGRAFWRLRRREAV